MMHVTDPPPPTTLFVSYLLRHLITKRDFVSRTIGIDLEEQSTLVSIDCLARRNMMQKSSTRKNASAAQTSQLAEGDPILCCISSTV